MASLESIQGINIDSMATLEAQTGKQQEIDQFSVQSCNCDCVCEKCSIDRKFPTLEEHIKSFITPPTILEQTHARQYYNGNVEVGRNILCAWCCKKCTNLHIKRNFSGAFQCKCGIIGTSMCSCNTSLDTSEFDGFI